MNNTQTKKDKILKILGIILDVFLVLIIVLSLYTVIARAVTGKSYAKVFGITAAVVHTGSMDGDREDSIEGNSLIFTVTKREYKVDDVVMYDTGKDTVTHRIIEVKENTFITQGDANTGSEEIPKYAVVGKVFLAIPKVGTAIRTVQENPMILMAIVLACAAVIIIPMLFRKSDE